MMLLVSSSTFIYQPETSLLAYSCSKVASLNVAADRQVNEILDPDHPAATEFLSRFMEFTCK